MLVRWMLVGLALLPAPVLAQDGSPPQRIRQVNLLPGQKCPEAGADEIVVCGVEDPEEMYRIPRRFREQAAVPGGVAWGARAETIMDVNRVGLPDSCSPVGTGGQTGCNAALLNSWTVGRREQRRLDNLVP